MILQREHIFARLRLGWAYEDIAREERVTTRRVRQIVSEALQRQQVDGELRQAPVESPAQPLRVSPPSPAGTIF